MYDTRFWAAAATIAACAATATPARAQVGDSYKIQLPELSAPGRASLAGSLSKAAFGASDVRRGSISLPSPYTAPEDRGPLLAAIFPTYSPEAGISEWGMGWAADLALKRWREAGDLDYATDDLSGPFGRCKKGADGNWYPIGLSALVRMEMRGPGFVAYTSDGTRWRFGQVKATRIATPPGTSPSGTYAWYLDEVETATGRRAALDYEANNSGMLFLRQVEYGGVGTAFEHRVTIEYAALPTGFTDYRSGMPLTLDRRVTGVKAWSRHATRRDWLVRWSFTPTYRFDDVGPGFYLEQVEQAYSSGEKAPAIQYIYELSADVLANASQQRNHKFDAVIAEYGSHVILPSYSTQLDASADGLVDFEVASDNTLVAQGPDRFTFEPLPPISDKTNVDCRAYPGSSNLPRPLAPMRASSEEPQVVVMSASPTSTYLLLCNRAGETVFETTLPDSWTLGPNTRVVDLNRDHQPDFIQVSANAYEAIPNTSSEAGYSFGAPVIGTLEPFFDPAGIWLQDFNGDGLPDIVGRYSSWIAVYFNKGNLSFEHRPQMFEVRDFSGGAIDPQGYQFTWLDADGDGLTDLVLSDQSQAMLLRNSGEALVPVLIGGELSIFNGFAQPLFVDLSGSGNAEVFFLLYDQGYSLALNSPGTGLLKAVDDGKGTRLTLTWERVAPTPGVRSRHAVLKSVLSESTGKDALTTTYTYDAAAVHSVGKYLVGFGQVSATTPAGSEVVSFLNGDYFAGLVASSRKRDVNAPLVEEIEERIYEDAVLPLPWKRLKSVVAGSRSVDGTQVSSQRTEYLTYESEVCAQEVRQCEDVLGAPCDPRTSDTLVTVSTRATISGFGSALHCLPARVETSGLHRDPTLDFAYSALIDRNAAGQLTELQSQSASGRLVLQTVTYDANFNAKTVSSPGKGTTTIGYEAATNLLAEVDGPAGIVAKVSEREPLIDRPRTIRVDRGGLPFQQYYRYDGLERLARRWNNLGSASELDPNELLTYRYAGGNMPATIYSSLLVDASAGATRNAVDYLTAGGELIGNATAIPEGWAFGSITERIQATRSQNAYLRRSISTAADPLALDYAALLASTTGVGQLRSTAEGAEASRTTVLHAGVERQLVTTWTVSGGQILESTVENDAFNVQRRLDGWKRVVQYQDEAGVTYGFTYDALGRVRRVDLPDGRKHAQTFDGHGRVVRVSRDGVASVESEYEATTGLLTRKTYFSPDGAGQRKVEFAYDSIGRKKLETYADLTTSQTKKYQYYYDGAKPSSLGARDDLGQLSAVTGDGYSKVFAHRPDGLLASRTTAVDGFPAIKLELTYYEDGSPRAQRIAQLDAAGRVLSSSERVLEVDGYGRLRDVTVNGSALVTAAYNENGLLSGGSFANGDQLTFTRDPTTRRLTGSTQASASFVISTLQEMNSRGLVKSETTTIGGTTLKRTFDYFEQPFLKSAVDAQSSYSYGFDGFGLPTFATKNGDTRAFFETPTNLTAGRVIYGFDSLHRTVSRSDASEPAQDLVLTYGPDGQVAAATKGGVTYRFRYDEDGQRLVKLTGSTPSVAYLPEGYLDSTGLTERFALGGRTVGIIKNGVYTTIATDLRGSVLAESTGVARIASPFGQRDVYPAMAAAIDYVEKGYDADLGWVRMGVRDYDPAINRFTTPDPLFLESPEKCVGAPIDCNLYSYAHNTPTVCTDPTGNCPSCVGGGLGAVVGGVAAGIISYQHGRRGWDLAEDVLFGVGMGGMAGMALGVGFGAASAALTARALAQSGESALAREEAAAASAAERAAVALSDATAKEAPSLSAAEGVAAKGAGKIALGHFHAGLEQFAESMGASQSRQWQSLGLFDEGLPGWGSAFEQAMNRTIQGGGRVLFNLTGVNIPEALSGDASVWVGRYTQWELQQVVGNPTYRAATDFYLNGSKLSPAEAGQLLGF
jgi:RHS repeat-associated protein